VSFLIAWLLVAAPYQLRISKLGISQMASDYPRYGELLTENLSCWQAQEGAEKRPLSGMADTPDSHPARLAFLLHFVCLLQITVRNVNVVGELCPPTRDAHFVRRRPGFVLLIYKNDHRSAYTASKDFQSPLWMIYAWHPRRRV